MDTTKNEAEALFALEQMEAVAADARRILAEQEALVKSAQGVYHEACRATDLEAPEEDRCTIQRWSYYRSEADHKEHAVVRRRSGTSVWVSPVGSRNKWAVVRFTKPRNPQSNWGEFGGKRYLAWGWV